MSAPVCSPTLVFASQDVRDSVKSSVVINENLTAAQCKSVCVCVWTVGVYNLQQCFDLFLPQISTFFDLRWNKWEELGTSAFDKLLLLSCISYTSVFSSLGKAVHGK